MHATPRSDSPTQIECTVHWGVKESSGEIIVRRLMIGSCVARHEDALDESHS